MRTSEPLVSLEGVNLFFRVDVHRAWTLRQLVIDTLQDPLGRLSREPERLTVARDISFKGYAGERIGILGVNGAGKTSLCRCIAGIYKPSSGSIRVQGSVRSVFNTSIGIQPELSGRENAELLAEFLFPEARNKTELVKEALDFSGLGSFVDVPFRLYSNGMQARLYLSLVSALPSDVFILDEVFEGADRTFTSRIAERMRAVMRSSGLVLFVSHSEDQVQSVCTRVLILDKGRLVFDGPTEEGLALYRTMHTPA